MISILPIGGGISEHALEFGVVPIGIDEGDAEVLVSRLDGNSRIIDESMDESNVLSLTVGSLSLVSVSWIIDCFGERSCDRFGVHIDLGEFGTGMFQ